MEPIPDGIMLGFIANPDGGEMPVAMHGSPADLIRVCRLLGLEPNQTQIEQIKSGDFDRDESGPLAFSDGSGSFVTLQPVSRASDFLANAMRTAHEHGLPFPF